MQAPEPSSTSRKQEILRQALTRKTPQEQAAYPDGACGDDAVLRAEMEALLAGKEEEQGTPPRNAMLLGSKRKKALPNSPQRS